VSDVTVQQRVAIGFTVKSGWASAVVVGGTRALPKVLEARRLDLGDPAVPDSRQPYHAGFGTARAQGADLSRPEPELRTMLGGLGRSVDGPWRTEQKAAALAAWLVLAR
jgi:hypothetical protein